MARPQDTRSSNRGETHGRNVVALHVQMAAAYEDVNSFFDQIDDSEQRGQHQAATTIQTNLRAVSRRWKSEQLQRNQVAAATTIQTGLRAVTRRWKMKQQPEVENDSKDSKKDDILTQRAKGPLRKITRQLQKTGKCIETVFAAMRPDRHTDTITKSGFHFGLKQLGISRLSPADVEALWVLMDPGYDGKATFQTFKRVIPLKSKPKGHSKTHSKPQSKLQKKSPRSKADKADKAARRRLGALEEQLFSAAATGDMGLLRELMGSEAGRRAGLTVNAQDAKGRHAVHYASQMGHVSVLSFLLQYQAVFNVADRAGRRPLHFAALDGQLQVCQWLAENTNIDVCAQDEYGRTPLHVAARDGHLSVVKWLCRQRRDVEENWAPMLWSPDQDGRTPLHFASRGGHQAVARWLVSQPHARGVQMLQDVDCENKTPADIARASKHMELAEYLEKALTEQHGGGKRLHGAGRQSPLLPAANQGGAASRAAAALHAAEARKFSHYGYPGAVSPKRKVNGVYRRPKPYQLEGLNVKQKPKQRQRQTKKQRQKPRQNKGRKGAKLRGKKVPNRGWKGKRARIGGGARGGPASREKSRSPEPIPASIEAFL